MIMVEVFKTNVEDPRDAVLLIDRIQKTFVGYKANFDLEDCDKILRIEGDSISHERIITTINKNGYQCQVLE